MLKILIENFNPNDIYLHGGPEKLDGDSFKRHGNKGHDMGALFFIKDSDVGHEYASVYASKYKNGAIYKVKINISPDKVFDFTNKNHVDIAKNTLSQQEFEYWANSKGPSGHLDWSVIDEELFDEMGFNAVLFHERSKGFDGYGEDAISIAVFDPKFVNIIEKEELKK